MDGTLVLLEFVGFVKKYEKCYHYEAWKQFRSYQTEGKS